MSPVEPPLVSVVMPVLSPDPAYFRLAVESILAQTWTDLELVIVEDPSPRTGAAVVEAIGDPRVRYLANAERTSLIRQRNQGLAAARGQYVAMLDADDIARPERIEKQVRFLEAEPSIAVLGTWLEAIDPEGRTIGYREYPTADEEIRRAFRRYNAIAQPSVMFRREVVVEAGGYTFEGLPGEDYELWSRLARRGARFANLPEPLLRYRIHPGASKAQRLRDTLRGTIKVKQEHWVGEMSLSDRMRLWAEGALLLMPSAFVLRVFEWITYHPNTPQSGTTGR